MMDELFETIRENASKEIWSRGVELARQDAVSGDRRTDTEIALRVFERARSISTLITLWPDDADWTKDCACKIDPCHHVAAAIIALKRAEEQGQELPQTKTAGGSLVYAFTRVEGALNFERFVVHADREEPKLLTIPLSQSHRLAEFAVSPTQADQAIESALTTDRRGRLALGTMTRLLPLLQNLPVTLDGTAVAIQKDPLGLTVEIRDEGLGVRILGKKDPRILETFHNGVVLSALGLHPQVDLSLDPSDRNMLLHGHTIPMRDIERFASEKLPQWEKRFVIDNKARNMPQFVEAEPELELLLERHGDQMLLMPGIVYGQPPIARIADGVFRPLGNLVPIRDHDEERRLKDQLWRNWGYELYHAKMLSAAEAIQAVENLESWRGKVRGDGAEQFRKVGGLLPVVKWNQGRLEIEFEGEGGTKSSAALVMKAWGEQKTLVPLFGGGFAQLPADWMQRYGQKIMDLMTAQNQGDTLPKAAFAQVLELFEDLGISAPTDLEIFARLKAGDWEERAPVLPKDMRVSLRPYQSQGVSWLQQMQDLELGALLADDMGLGKTVQAIAALKRHTLIIAPTSVLPNWRRELQRFRPNLKVALYHGSARNWDADADVILTSYGLLRQDLELLQSRIWETIILDEAQIIKNSESKVALAAFQLKSNFRIALSGTPVENRLEDLWSIFAFLNPGLLGTKKEFRERWAKGIEDGDHEASLRLRKILKPFILRRLKSQVAKDLPPRIEKTLYSELWPEERKLYDAIYATTRKEVVQKLEAGGSIFEALEALLRMRQAACHPALVPSQTAAHSSKLTLLVESLQTALAEDHKALVFSQWTGLLDLLEPVLEAAGITFLRLDGSTKDRQSIVDQFQAVDGPPVLIMSLKAGGVGLNLTAADHVFILDPWWNPAAADQAADRAHRIGQTRSVMIHPLVALDTVEEKIMELQAMKRALAEASLGEGEGTGVAITRQDILDLLGGGS